MSRHPLSGGRRAAAPALRPGHGQAPGAGRWTVTEGWAPHLAEGERLVWSGAPDGRLWLVAERVPAAVIGIGTWLFAGLWVAVAQRAGLGLWPGAAAPVLLLGAAGLWLVWGQFWWDARQRRRTAYALTEGRALIRTGARVAAHALDRTPELRAGPAGLGTVWLAEERAAPPPGFVLGQAAAAGLAPMRRVGFRLIPDAAEVHALALAQRAG